MTWLIVLLVVIAILASLPIIQEARRSLPDPSLAPGEFADLSDGRTHYLWHGGARGPVAVCIHGLTTPSPVWDGLVPDLLRLGYRVLVYDLYGRGYSDNATGRQDARFFCRQLEELLADQNVTEDVTLFGYSMGGAIATSFTAGNPHLVQRVVLIAPAGIAIEEDRPDAFGRKVPVIGAWLHSLVEPIRMRRALEREPQEMWPEILASRRAGLDRRGYFQAVLSSRKNMLADVQETEHRAISREGIPVLAVFAELDDVIPLRAMGQLTAWNRTARKEMIDGAGHDVAYAEGPLIAGIFRDFLREQ